MIFKNLKISLFNIRLEKWNSNLRKTPYYRAHLCVPAIFLKLMMYVTFLIIKFVQNINRD